MERTGCLITFAIGDCTECKVSKQDRSITSKAKQSKKKNTRERNNLSGGF